MQTQTHSNVNAMASRIEFTSEELSRRFESVAEGSVADVWFTLHVRDDSEFSDVVTAIISDTDVKLHKADRDEGFVSARHVDYTPEE
jgi:hypothetical protein